jgi:hypothetical protein
MEPPRPLVPPISGELWARLRRFDRICELSMCRCTPVAKSPWAETHRKVWVATIRTSARAYQQQEMAQAVHPTLSEALRLVVEDAERRGWVQA